jgi:uncharacterized membrane protein YdjX (TVP38/TMEM64 family)
MAAVMNVNLALLRRKRLWVALAIASSLVVLISHVPFGSWIHWIAVAHSWLAGQGEWAIPTFMALYIMAAILGLPNIVLILAAGTLFGLTQGVVSASIADTLSIAACFVIGQTVGRRWITNTVRENSRFHKLDKAFAQKGWKIVLLTRLSPVLPSNILNYGFSLTRINFWEYLFFSWLGMLPVIFTYVYIGTFGATVLTLDKQSDNLIFQAIGLAATLGVMVYATKLAASALKTEEPESAPCIAPASPATDAISSTGVNLSARQAVAYKTRRRTAKAKSASRKVPIDRW